MNNHQPDYGNWISRPFMTMLCTTTAILFLLFAACRLWLHSTVADVILGTLAVLALAFTIYMYMCRRIFSSEGNNLQSKVHHFLLAHLPWDGHGRLLDIGCGSGALSVRCAKHFASAHIVGIDYWGMMWDYSLHQCEQNANREGVADRTEFHHGDAARLHFADASFDAVVSNFVFHEVKTQPDKRLLIREALRVLRPGGSFALQDVFGLRSLYGDIKAFVDQLRSEGYSDIHYVERVERQPFVPKLVRTPWMFNGVGLIYGRKPE